MPDELPLNDVEAVCSFERDNTMHLVPFESGAPNRSHRAVRFAYDADGVVPVLKQRGRSIDLKKPLDGLLISCEAAVLIAKPENPDNLRILVADRERRETEHPVLHAASMDLDFNSAAVSGVTALDIKMPGAAADYDRICSDLALDAQGRLLAAMARDPGDYGPFASAIYDIGDLAAVLKSPMSQTPICVSVPDGLKVEAITQARGGDHEVLMLGTDDEAGGGIVRSILPRCAPRASFLPAQSHGHGSVRRHGSLWEGAIASRCLWDRRPVHRDSTTGHVP